VAPAPGRYVPLARPPWRVPALLWAGPGTLLGLALALLARVSGGRVRRREGVFEAHGGALKVVLWWLGGRASVVEAFTLGHVILARDAARLAEHRAHERTHVRQWERWGPLFLPAYAALSLWARARGRDAYRANRFEREAWGDPPDSGEEPPRA
jgi:hypothetical protein